jgi:hypothetical protein
MRSPLKSKKGLSTVVTTLIILVVSILLCTVVTYYAINVTTTRMAQENLYLSKAHIWVNITASKIWAEGAIVIANTGGKDIVFNKFTVRSQWVNWTNVYYWTINNGSFISSDLSELTVQPSKTNANITIQGTAEKFIQGSQTMVLKSGYTMVLYINNPDSIGYNDIGTTATITIYTANAMWSQEAPVQAS